MVQGLIGFFDGVTYSVCRPGGREQRCMYSGHKKEHCYREQTLVLVNGLIMSMFGPYKGASNDQELLHFSGILHVLDQAVPPGFVFYGDKGYIRTHQTPRLVTPFRGVDANGPGLLFNKRMSMLRVTVEWPFGAKGFGLKAEFAYFQQRRRPKVTPVWVMWACSTFLYNIITCIEGSEHNQVARHFGVSPPDIQEYMAGL